MLHAVLEQNLQPDTDSQHRPAARQSAVDHLVTTDRPDPFHAGAEGADAGHDEPGALLCPPTVGGQLDVRAGPLQSAYGGAHVAEAVVEDHDPGG